MPVRSFRLVVHESKGRGNTVVGNANGSIDVVLTGINSIHFKELQTKGVLPHHLLDECYSIFVGAWLYSKKVARWGNNWKAVGAYHSGTPYFNERYQVLIYNQMVQLGLISGQRLAVPPLPKRCHPPAVNDRDSYGATHELPLE